jgi:glycosyltransferase involved in cell wall biosynthesis
VLVVDDGSTDAETRAAIDTLPAGVEVLRQANAGHGPARTAGVRATEEPYLCMLDADDRLMPDAARQLRAGLLDDPRAAFAYGRTRFFGDWAGEVRFPEFDRYRILYRNLVVWIGMVRRTAYEEVGGFDPAVGGFEDWDFVLSTLERGWHASQVDGVVLDYRKHANSMLKGHRTRHRELYRARRRKHRALYERRREFARESDLGPLGRLWYRSYWAWRPLPARLEHAIYARLFRP